MGMLIGCAKGCGHSIEVTSEQVQEAITHGSNLIVEHEVCPTDPSAVQRRFKIVTQVFELKMEDSGIDGVEPVETPELLSSIGKTVEAGSFKLALRPLADELTRQWAIVEGMADTIDQADKPEGGEEATPEG